MPKMNAGYGNGGGYEETPEEREKWKAFAGYVRTEVKPRPESTFLVPGYIKTIAGDPNDPSKARVQDPPVGTDWKPREVVDVTAVTTDARFSGLAWRKTIGYSFFSGKRKNGQRSNPGGMWLLHKGVTGVELAAPPAEIDTDDYTGPERPVMLRLKFIKREEEGSEYYGRRGNLNIRLDGFEPMVSEADEWGDEDALGSTEPTATPAQEIKREAVRAASGPQSSERPPWEDDEEGAPF